MDVWTSICTHRPCEGAHDGKPACRVVRAGLKARQLQLRRDRSPPADRPVAATAFRESTSPARPGRASGCISACADGDSCVAATTATTRCAALASRHSTRAKRRSCPACMRVRRSPRRGECEDVRRRDAAHRHLDARALPPRLRRRRRLGTRTSTRAAQAVCWRTISATSGAAWPRMRMRSATSGAARSWWSFPYSAALSTRTATMAPTTATVPCTWALGGSVHGGRIAGRQIALAPQHLLQNRDYPVLTNVRVLLGGLLQRSWGLSPARMQTALPGSKPLDLQLV